MRGYESDEIIVGSGFSGPHKGYELIQCRVCHHFGASGMLTKEKRCSHCRSRKVRVFNDEQLTGLLTCPACGRQTAVASNAGLWD